MKPPNPARYKPDNRGLKVLSKFFKDYTEQSQGEYDIIKCIRETRDEITENVNYDYIDDKLIVKAKDIFEKYEKK